MFYPCVLSGTLDVLLCSPHCSVLLFCLDTFNSGVDRFVEDYALVAFRCSCSCWQCLLMLLAALSLLLALYNPQTIERNCPDGNAVQDWTAMGFLEQILCQPGTAEQ